MNGTNGNELNIEQHFCKKISTQKRSIRNISMNYSFKKRWFCYHKISNQSMQSFNTRNHVVLRLTPYWKIQRFPGNWQLKHPISLTPIDRCLLKSLYSKFQLDVILFWQDMWDNINYTSPLNTVQ